MDFTKLPAIIKQENIFRRLWGLPLVCYHLPSWYENSFILIKLSLHYIILREKTEKNIIYRLNLKLDKINKII